MKFADEVKANYTPKKAPEKAAREEIYASAQSFVDFLKNDLMKKAKSGSVTVKKGFLTSKKRVSITVSLMDSDHILIPAPGWYDGKINPSYWYISKNKETMKIWHQRVSELIRQSGIKVDSSRVSAYNSNSTTYYIDV